MELNAIGLMEFSSIARGFTAQDAMLKAANVTMLMARTICSGKYLIAIAGDVDDVQSGLAAGASVSRGAIIEKRIITRVHPSIFPAILGNVALEHGKSGALGIIETFSASSIIDVADTAVKAANVTLFRVHLAMALGGKGFVLMTGDVASVQAAVDAGSAVAGEDGILVDRQVIPAPSKELFKEFV